MGHNLVIRSSPRKRAQTTLRAFAEAALSYFNTKDTKDTKDTKEGKSEPIGTSSCPAVT